MIRKLIRTYFRKFMSIDNMMKIYFACVQSIISYCLSIDSKGNKTITAKFIATVLIFQSLLIIILMLLNTFDLTIIVQITHTSLSKLDNKNC